MGFWVRTAADLPQVNAEVDFQENGPYGCSTVRQETFDCTRALSEIPFDDLPEKAEDFRGRVGACDYGDDIFYIARRHGAVSDWDGPFEVYVDIESYARYYRARSILEMARPAPCAARHV